MSMPQYFSIVVFSNSSRYSGEIASAVTTLLRAPDRGIQPDIIAAATLTRCRLALSKALANRGLVVCRAVSYSLLDPRSIDLWLALDDSAEAAARWKIDESGPSPNSFYRRAFPDTVKSFGTHIASPPPGKHLDEWLNEIESAVIPWRVQIWKAFEDSS